MCEQHKRGLVPESAEPSHTGKKLKPQPQAMVPNGLAVVKHEPRGIHPQQGMVVGSGGGEVVAVATAETMDEPQINLQFGVSRFHCLACLRPIKPPTFKCGAAHVVCGACPEVDAIISDAKLPCPFSELGCPSLPVYFQAADHERGCHYAPCYCPILGCETYTSPTNLLDHFRSSAHAWPVTEISYGKPCELAMPANADLHALVGKEDRRVFLVSASALGACVAVSVVCLRANGGDTAGVPQYRCKLWVESRRSAGDVAMVTFSLASKDMSGGLVAAELGSFLAVTPDLLHAAAGETAVLRVRIDKVSGDGGGAAPRSLTPPASCSVRQP
ncbi:hypothetical protein PR202_ga23656 [Eleusine coracana subsp. coracana]|uniref:SIAH-type domain-containing protein n=1 Tax=Eleusine coracana subsp. coracana TaxID=191504 RepID=A0AAV5D6E4_ELECO|nr:hypothetical protein PR202_ga23656 [Eleusine coracana subsp. coracana]